MLDLQQIRKAVQEITLLLKTTMLLRVWKQVQLILLYVCMIG